MSALQAPNVRDRVQDAMRRLEAEYRASPGTARLIARRFELGGTDTETISSATGIATTELTAVLRSMEGEGLVLRSQWGRHVYWKLIAECNATTTGGGA